MLNVEKVRQLASERGLKLAWISQKVGVTRHIGYVMFRDGLLPKDHEVRSKALRELSKLLGVPAQDLLMHLTRA